MNTYDKVPLGLQSCGLETLQDFTVTDNPMKKQVFLKKWLLYVASKKSRVG